MRSRPEWAGPGGEKTAVWIQESQTFDTTVGRIYDLMTSESFQQAKSGAVGALRSACVVTKDGAGVRVESRRVLQPVNVPEFIKAMVEPTISVTEVETWAPNTGDEPRQGGFRVDVSGAPITVVGAVSIEPTGAEGCTVTFRGELATSIPLFKSAIERAAAGQVTGTIHEEFRLLHHQLALWEPNDNEGTSP